MTRTVTVSTSYVLHTIEKPFHVEFKLYYLTCRVFRGPQSDEDNKHPKWLLKELKAHSFLFQIRKGHIGDQQWRLGSHTAVCNRQSLVFSALHVLSDYIDQ